MTRTEAFESVKRLDSECAALDRKIQSAKRRYELALSEMIHAEREHAAACQRRTALEGRHMDLLNPVNE